MKYLTTLIPFLLLSLFLPAQNVRPLCQVLSDTACLKANTTPVLFLCERLPEKDAVKAGTPAFTKGGWTEGLLADLENQVFKLPMRFVPEDDRLEIMLDGAVQAIYPEKIRGAQLGSRRLIPAELPDKDGVGRTYLFELHAEGLLNLIYRPKAKGKGPKSGWYTLDEAGAVKPLPTVPLAFWKIFGEQEKVVQEEARQNGWSMRREEDLVKLFDFYNSLFQ